MSDYDYYCQACGFSYETHDTQGRCPTDKNWGAGKK